MLEQRIRIVSESLARGVNRRAFLQKSGTAFTAGIMALAAGHTLNGFAQAQNKGKPGAGAGKGSNAGEPSAPNVPQCTPPGPYCNLDGNTQDPNGCHGARCYQHRYNGAVLACQVFYTYYPAGCWTNAAGGGYWTCCDCQCTGGVTCGCGQFSLNAVDNPD